MKLACGFTNRAPASAAFFSMARSTSGSERRVLPGVGFMLASLLAVFALAAHADTDTYWSIKDLGTLGGRYSFAFGINDHGQVVGQSLAHNGTDIHAFLYQDGVMTDLGPAGQYNSARGINNAGQIAAYAIIDRQRYFPLVYKDGVINDIGVSGYSYGINHAGHVIGTLSPAEGGGAFVHKDGVTTKLGTLGGSYSNAFGINKAGDIVGNSEISGGSFHAYVYRDRRMIDLGTLGGSYSIAFGINDKGRIVGGSATNNDKSSHAFLYDETGMHDLGTLGGTFGVASGINNAGQIVGTSSAVPYGDQRAFLYSRGVMIDLNTLPAVQKAGWLLMFAEAINKKGQIVGAGIINGEQHAFLLSPSSPLEPHDEGYAQDSKL
jgi:probable HAF family extracellular repeat protein